MGNPKRHGREENMIHKGVESMAVAAYITAAFTAFLCILCMMEREKRKAWCKKKVVHLPFFLAVIGMVCGGLLCIPMVLSALDGSPVSIFFCVIVLACDSMMVAYRNCVIQYDDKGFLARNFFGIRRECSYAHVEGIRSGKDCRVYFQGHSIMIDEISIGGDRFIEAIDKGHKKTTGKWVTALPSFRRRWDPMNGHLDHPWGYFILWIVMGLVCVALFVLGIWTMTRETDPADIVLYEVRFCGYEVDQGTLILYADGQEEPFDIAYYRDYGETLPAPEVLCNGAEYSVGVVGHRVVRLTGLNETEYITPESERQVYRNSQKPAVWILGAAVPIGLVICYFGIAVARHPERYSKGVRQLFYKDGVLH